MRKRRSRRKPVTAAKRSGRRTVLALVLISIVVSAGAILGQRLGGFSQTSRKKPAAPQPDAAITPASFDSPSKELVYAGGKLVVTEEPAVTQPAFAGFHDGAGCNTISGWAWDSSNPNATVNVDLFDGATPILQAIPASMYREDLLNILTSPNHGFSIPTPASLKNGSSHSVSIRFSGTSTVLGGSPKTLQCNQAPLFKVLTTEQAATRFQGGPGT